MKIGDIGKLLNTSGVEGLSKVNNEENINCVFGNRRENPSIEMHFSAEEQHILGIFASVQDNVLIEE